MIQVIRCRCCGVADISPTTKDTGMCRICQLRVSQEVADHDRQEVIKMAQSKRQLAQG